MSQQELLPQVVACPRCGKLCKYGTPDPEARPFRKAKPGAGGMCLECCFASLFQVETPDNQTLPYAYKMAVANGFKPDNLLLPHFQEQFKRLLIVGKSQADFSEIDWNSVVEKWDLPFPETKKAGRAPRRPSNKPLWN